MIIAYVKALVYLMCYLKYRTLWHLNTETSLDACKDLGQELITEKEADSKGFWQWCITPIIIGVLEFVSHLPEVRNRSSFRNVVFSVF
jgi:hypothetical protein